MVLLLFNQGQGWSVAQVLEVWLELEGWSQSTSKTGWGQRVRVRFMNSLLHIGPPLAPLAGSGGKRGSEPGR